MSKFIELLPHNLQKDETIKSLTKVLDNEIKAIDELTDKLLLYANLDEQSEDVVDELARSFHILPNEGYRFADTLTKKRELVRNSLALHRHKGTLYAVKEVLKILGIKGKVLEWFEYGGEPYNFKIDMLVEGMGDKEIVLLEDMINQVKNVRSRLENFNISSLVSGSFYTGAAVVTAEEINVWDSPREFIDVYGRLVVPQTFMTGEYISVNNK